MQLSYRRWGNAEGAERQHMKPKQLGFFCQYVQTVLEPTRQSYKQEGTLKTPHSLTTEEEFTTKHKPQNNQKPDKKIKYTGEFQNTL